MKVGLAVTNFCGAKCLTCLSHLIRPKCTLTPEQFDIVLNKISGIVHHLFLNSIGDFLWLPNVNEYVDIINKFHHKHPNCYISVTTNAGWPIDRRNKIKPLNISLFVVSFNASSIRISKGYRS